MKKIIILSFIVLSVNIQAQFTLTKVGTTTQILNNDVFVYNTVGNSAAELKFKINNQTAAPINIKIRCVSISNADGTGMQFCFNGTCISDVVANTNYPTDNPYYAQIPAMGNNGNFDHFRNDNTGDGTSVQNYVFKFFQVDNLGNEIGNNSITITYRYTPVLSSTNFSLSNLGIQLKSNVVDNQLEINSDKNDIKVKVIDLNGKQVNDLQLSSSINFINVNNLKQGMYLLNFIDTNGQSATTKFVKK